MMRLSGAWNDSAYTTHDASTGGGLDAAKHARVRAVPLNETNSPKSLLHFLEEAKASGAPFTSVVGVRPTGWTHTNASATTKGGKSAASAGEFNGGLLRPRVAGGRASSSGAGGEVEAAAPVPSNAGGARRPALDSFLSRCEDGSGVFESNWGDDQDDESAAWGAGGKGVGEEEAVVGEGEGTVPGDGAKSDECGLFVTAVANCFSCLEETVEPEEATGGGGSGGVLTAAGGAGGGIEEKENGVGRGGDVAGGGTLTLIPEGGGRATTLPPVSPAAGGGRWTGKKPWVEGNARVYSLPYSEHSSFTQLRDFVRAVRPK